MQLQNVLVALQEAQQAVNLAIDYEDEEAVNDAAFAIVQLLQTLNNNNFDVVSLAQQALEV
jgi:hypothetical protein